jgi:hypothetical protein
MNKPLLTPKQIGFVAIFAALQIILGALPYVITIGVSGQITLGVIGGPLIGILLGPSLGGLAVLIGSLIGVFLNPSGAIFGFLTVIPPTLGAIGAGSVMLKKGYIPGTIILASILAFYAHPYGRESLLFPWLHIIAIIIAFASLALVPAELSKQANIKKLVWIVSMSAFVGTLTDHMFGNALAIWYFSYFKIFELVPEIWHFLMFVYPIERIVVVIITAIIALPLYYSLQRTGLLTLQK